MKKDQLRTTADVYPLGSIRVIDGDTIEAEILLPFGTKVQKRIRLKGWWAPELRGQHRDAGIQAKARLESWIKDKDVWMVAPTARMDRFGRVVAHLWHLGEIVAPTDVLRELQLSQEQHRLMYSNEEQLPVFVGEVQTTEFQNNESAMKRGAGLL